MSLKHTSDGRSVIPLRPDQQPYRTGAHFLGQFKAVLYIVGVSRNRRLGVREVLSETGSASRKSSAALRCSCLPCL
jgi:hypothetical protein